MNIKIESEYITLGQFLKHASIIQTGGQAKDFINTTQIEVNGKVSNQRGKKLYPGDTVKVTNTVYTITG